MTTQPSRSSTPPTATTHPPRDTNRLTTRQLTAYLRSPQTPLFVYSTLTDPLALALVTSGSGPPFDPNLFSRNMTAATAHGYKRHAFKIQGDTHRVVLPTNDARASVDGWLVLGMTLWMTKAVESYWMAYVKTEVQVQVETCDGEKRIVDAVAWFLKRGLEVGLGKDGEPEFVEGWEALL